MFRLLKIAQIMLATQQCWISCYCICLLLWFATLRILKFSIGVYRLVLVAVEETLLCLNRVLIAARRTLCVFRLFLITWRTGKPLKRRSNTNGNAPPTGEKECSGHSRASARKRGRNDNQTKAHPSAPGTRRAGHMEGFR